jgi:hypothetical protein
MLRRSIPYWANGKRGGGADPNAIFNDATVLLSVKKLNTSYSGPCWRVRRVSDNTLHDIGFDVDGLVDEAELTTILGAGVGRLNIWYDQKDNNDATATTTTVEPLVWNNGIIAGLNGLPAIDFEGTTIRKLNFASGLQFVTANGAFMLNVIQGVGSQNEIIVGDTANRFFRVQTTNNLQSSGIFGFINVLTDAGDRRIVGIRSYRISGDIYNQLFDENTDSPAVNQTAIDGITTWTLNQIGLGRVSSEPFRGLQHELIYFDDYTLADDSAIITSRQGVYK